MLPIRHHNNCGQAESQEDAEKRRVKKMRTSGEPKRCREAESKRCGEDRNEILSTHSHRKWGLGYTGLSISESNTPLNHPTFYPFGLTAMADQNKVTYFKNVLKTGQGKCVIWPPILMDPIIQSKGKVSITYTRLTEASCPEIYYRWQAPCVPGSYNHGCRPFSNSQAVLGQAYYFLLPRL